MISVISNLLNKRKNKLGDSMLGYLMTVRQLLQKQKYRCKIVVSYYSTVAGCDVDETFFITQYEDLLFQFGHKFVDWFYIKIDPNGPVLVIELL